MRVMNHHMVLSSCGIYPCRRKVGLCAFNLSVNEMFYQSISERLLSVQVFMCQSLCIWEKCDWCVCAWGDCVQLHGRSGSVHFHLIYLKLIVPRWANQCPPSQPMSPAVPWEQSSVMNGSLVSSNAHLHAFKKTHAHTDTSQDRWALFSSQQNPMERKGDEGDKDGWVMIKVVADA